MRSIDPATLSFSSWVDRFAGENEPAEDVSEYLNDLFGVQVSSLAEEVKSADELVSAAVRETWMEIHRKRRESGDADLDEHLVYRLADHDVENYLGVLEKRRRELGKYQFGHATWWLTLDSAAWQISKTVAERVGTREIDNPVMSPDFLVNYLVLGPNRGRISKETELHLPLIVDWVIDDVPNDFMDVVSDVRGKHKDQPERIMRRRIRDALNAAKQRRGQISDSGISGLEKKFGIN